MKHLTGSLAATASLDSEQDKNELVAEINRVIKPSRAATVDNVYLGVLDAASNRVNAQGGCFGLAELARLAGLIVDVPVLIGHKKQELPIGRVFKAEVIERDGAPWLRAYFYWHREQTGADELKAGIDAGVYRECSLGFLYAQPECGICGLDMRNCRHRVHEPVRVGNREVRAFYFYRKIQRVFEVSLVYRGAVDGTAVSTLAHPNAHGEADPFWRQNAAIIFDPSQLTVAPGELLIEPLYRGVWLRLDSSGAQMPNGEGFDHPAAAEAAAKIAERKAVVICQAIAMRGSSRLPVRSLLRSSNRARARLVAFDILRLDGHDLAHLSLHERRRSLQELVEQVDGLELAPLQRCSLGELATHPERHGSADGARIISITAGGCTVTEFRRKTHLRVTIKPESLDEHRHSLVAQLRDGETLKLELPDPAPDLKTPLVWIEAVPGDSQRWRMIDSACGDRDSDPAEVLTKLPPRTRHRFVLLLDTNGNAWLHLRLSGTERLFKIALLRLPLLQLGRRFWSAAIEASPAAIPQGVRVLDRGVVEQYYECPESGATLTLTGETLRDRYVFSRTKLSGHRAFLFSRSASAAPLPSFTEE